MPPITSPYYGVWKYSMVKLKYIILFSVLLLITLFVMTIFHGTTAIPAKDIIQILLGNSSDNEVWNYIITQVRLSQALTALFAGASLAVAGLMLQTLFDNPLASPSILGIDTGAGLGVALVVLFIGQNRGQWSAWSNITLIGSAFMGALVVLLLLLLVLQLQRNKTTLLIVGLMIGYLSSSVISLLSFFGSQENVFFYTIWGMGNFSSVNNLPLFIFLLSLSIIISTLLIKPLNALLLGENYARNLGVNIKVLRIAVFTACGITIATVTAFCGPITFIGLTVPHIARLLTKKASHAVLLPLTLLFGGIIMLLCNYISNFSDSAVIPINAITPIIGAPIILYIIFKKR